MYVINLFHSNIFWSIPTFNVFLLITSTVVEIQQCFINENNFTFALISRRSVLRAGTRYNSRGVDSQGNVSNNVETEQIIVTEETKNILSYLQTRGSMPLFWRQDVNVKYVPKLVLESRTESVSLLFIFSVSSS